MISNHVQLIQNDMKVHIEHINESSESMVYSRREELLSSQSLNPREVCIGEKGFENHTFFLHVQGYYFLYIKNLNKISPLPLFLFVHEIGSLVQLLVQKL